MSKPIKPPPKNSNPPTEETINTPKKKRRTLKQINTLKLIHERIDWYDTLRRKYTTEPTPENKEELDNYSVHLRNIRQLALYIGGYIDENKLEDTLLAYSKIRKIILEELEAGNLFKSDGLIRNSNVMPYSNVPSTGNVIPIVLPEKYIEKLKTYLIKELVDESVRILVPCNNLMLIVEIGEHTEHMNEELKRKIFQIIMIYVSDNRLPLPRAFEPDGIVKYILY